MVTINDGGNNGFDATAVEPQKAFEPLPAGDYLCVITNSEMKPTKKGDGQYLEVQLEVLDGPHKGRRLFDRFNLQNPNPQAVEIARRQFSGLCHAVNVMRVQDSCQLHNIPCVVQVKCKKRDDNGEWSNEVGGYKAKSTTPAATAPAAGGAAPWAR